MGGDVFWDKNISMKEVKEILKDDSNKKFIGIAAVLLSRKNEPKEVFSEYIDKITFCRNWRFIKKRMRENTWNDNRIIFWDEIYKVVVKNIDKEKLKIKKSPRKIIEGAVPQIGKRIKKERQKSGQTQKEVSKETGLSQQTISAIEKGSLNFSVKTLLKITEAFNLEITFNPKEAKNIANPETETHK